MRRRQSTHQDHSTRIEDTASAASKVFGTVELLEQILLGLPLTDALNARSVSKTWKSTFVASPSLQKGCFLTQTADPLPLTGVWLVGRTSVQVNNAARGWRKTRSAISTPIFLGAPKATLTPALVLANCAINDAHVLNPLALRALRLRCKVHRDQYEAASRRLGRPNSYTLWTKMFLTQPPTTTVQIRRVQPYYSHYVIELSSETEPIVKQGGVTIGDLLARMAQYQHDDDSDILGKDVLYAGVLELPTMERKVGTEDRRAKTITIVL